MSVTSIRERITFQSGGQSIGIQCFESSTVPGPAILLLHGAGGVESGGRYVAQLATALNEGGFSTFILEYFCRTGTTHATDSEMQQSFELWLETIRDAVTFICERPSVDATRLGTFGYSLGGYLAVAHAAQDNRVRAVVEFAGGIDPEYAHRVHRLPPLLILHGEGDRRVPFLRALELETLARRLGSPVETEFYPGERHVLSLSAAMQAMRKALQFFGKYLK